MTFHSILFQSAADRVPDERLAEPDFFVDLNLDQIVAAVTAGRDEYNLKPFFYTSLHDIDAITYRHEVMQALEDIHLFDIIKAFAQSMRTMRQHLAQSGKLRCRQQKERWFLDAVQVYCEAVTCLVHGLSVAEAGGHHRALPEPAGRGRRGHRPALQAGGRLFAFGNGGSATDAEGTVDLFLHPPSGRPLPAISLVDDRAVLTALANDVGFDLVFSRQIIAHARAGDVAVGFSTSGDSVNVLRGLEEAARRGLLTIGLCGYDGGAMAASDAVAHCLVVRSESVHRVQETQNALMLELWSIVQRLLRRGCGVTDTTQEAGPASREAAVFERIEAFRRRRPRLLDEVVTLAHGAGGKASAALLAAVFLPAFAGRSRRRAGRRRHRHLALGRATGVQHRLLRRQAAPLPRWLGRPPGRARHRQRSGHAGSATHWPCRRPSSSKKASPSTPCARSSPTWPRRRRPPASPS